MAELRRTSRRWAGRTCVVAATGPSLTPAVADLCRGQLVLAVNDAWRLIPWAEVLYACDARWWDFHQGCHGFIGERWSSHSTGAHGDNDKMAAADRWGLNLIAGRNDEGFSLDPGLIHYGDNGGFQALNLAILFGAARILLAGFDMHSGKGRHFFGEHPEALRKDAKYEHFVPNFRRAAGMVPPGTVVLNCTPGSAIDCFQMADLEEALLCSSAA